MTSLPAIERCIGLYLSAYDVFGEASFSFDALATSIDQGAEIEHTLDLLIAYGLVERTDESRYRICRQPDEEVAKWREYAADRAETLHELVSERREPSRATSERERLQHGGESYASIYVTGDDTVGTVIETARQALDASTDDTGLVLRSPADEAGHVQQVADTLREGVPEANRPQRFEKEYSTVVGDHKDDIEFRLFLRKE